MKMIWFIFVAVTMPVLAFASDISLTDGRILKDASIVSQTPRKVAIKHAAGLSSVAKELLPTELRTLYPIDEAAARESEKKAIDAREAAINAQKAETERLARVRAQREASAEEYVTNQAKEAARKEAQVSAVKAKARTLTERYFSRGAGSAVVTINEVRPVEGVNGKWFLTGQAVIKTYRSTPRYSTFSLGGDSAEEWRQQYNQNQMVYQNQNRPSSLSCNSTTDDTRAHDHSASSPDAQRGARHNSGEIRDRKYRDEEVPPLFVTPAPQTDTYEYSSEIKRFEAYYSTDDSSPTIDITSR